MTMINRSGEFDPQASAGNSGSALLHEGQPQIELDMCELVSEALEIARSKREYTCAEEGLMIHESRELEEVPAILGNALELRKVVAGLALTACEAMQDAGELRTRCYATAGHVCVEVEDNGAGLSENDRQQLFNPPPAGEEIGSTGMNLHEAYEIVKRHRGEIEVISEPGKGTKWILSFRIRGARKVEPAKSAQPGECTAPGRILVIDDEEPIAELLKEALLLDGHTVEVTASASVGIDLACQDPYDLVMTDLDMPEMSGWEVARRIQAHSPASRIILVTGWGAAITDQEIRESGVAAIVHKPFEIKELLITTSLILAHSER